MLEAIICCISAAHTPRESRPDYELLRLEQLQVACVRIKMKYRTTQYDMMCFNVLFRQF